MDLFENLSCRYNAFYDFKKYKEETRLNTDVLFEP